MCIEWPFICMVGPKRVSIARLFTCLRCRCRIRLLIRHLQKKAKRWESCVVVFLSARFKTVLDLSQLISILITGSSSLSFQRGFVFVFELNIY